MPATTTKGGALRGASDLKRLRAARMALVREIERRPNPELEIALAAVEDLLCAALARRREEAGS